MWHFNHEVSTVSGKELEIYETPGLQTQPPIQQMCSVQDVQRYGYISRIKKRIYKFSFKRLVLGQILPIRKCACFALLDVLVFNVF